MTVSNSKEANMARSQWMTGIAAGDEVRVNGGSTHISKAFILYDIGTHYRVWEEEGYDLICF